MPLMDYVMASHLGLLRFFFFLRKRRKDLSIYSKFSLPWTEHKAYNVFFLSEVTRAVVFLFGGRGRRK